jgi:putative oxidoreductase
MTDSRTAPYASLLLRLALGILFLAHFGLKFCLHPGGNCEILRLLGLPGGLAYVTMAVELLGAIALILGIYARVVAIVLIPILLGAIFTVHGPAGFFFTSRMAVGNSRILDCRPACTGPDR